MDKNESSDNPNTAKSDIDLAEIKIYSPDQVMNDNDNSNCNNEVSSRSSTSGNSETNIINNSQSTEKENKGKLKLFFGRTSRFFRLVFISIRNSRSLQIIISLFILSMILGVLAYIFKDDLLPILKKFSLFVASNGVPGGLLYVAMLVISCFPPLFGYSLLLTLSGYIYGVGIGFLINFIGALIGGLVCFTIARILGRSWISGYFKSDSSNKSDNITKGNNTTKGARTSSIELDSMGKYELHPDTSSESSSVDHVIEISDEQNGKHSEKSSPDNIPKYTRLLNLITLYLEANPGDSYKLLILLRLAPYPYNILNVLLAQIPAISYFQFTCITAVSLVKTVLHAWVGSTLSQLEELFAGPLKKLTENNGDAGSDGTVRLSSGQIAQILVMCLAVVFAVLGSVYLYRTVEHALQQVETDKKTVTESHIPNTK